MRSRSCQSTRGFTLVEVLVVAMLTTVLATLLASAWSGLGRPVVDAMRSARIMQEANLALASLEHDFCGSLPDNSGRLGVAADGQFVGRSQPYNTQLRLCFDGGTPDQIAAWGAPDIVITYLVQNGLLIRWNENDGTVFVVARYVDSMETFDEGGGVQIKLTFTYRKLTRTYTFVGVDP